MFNEPASGLRGRSVEQSSPFRCGQIYKNYWYDLGYTLLRCLSSA